MRWFLIAIVLTGFTMTLNADTFLYVSKAAEKEIQIYRLDTTNGSLTDVGHVHPKGAPGSLAVDTHKRYLFASVRSTSTLESYSRDAKTGKLKFLSSVALPKDENAAFVGTDRTGRWLISASYAAGKVVVHKIGDDGKIQTPAVQIVSTALTAHAFATDPTNAWVFVPHVAPNAIFQFRLDAMTGNLKEAGKAPGGTPKAGPRHLAWHPTLGWAYSSDETGNSITAFQFDAQGGLKARQTLSTLPDDFKGKNTTAEVKVHPTGKFVYVSNRGHDSLAGFRIDDKGMLKSLGQTPTEKTPRSFEHDPDGRYIFGAGEGSGKLAVYSVNTASGALSLIHTYDVGKSLTWVMAVKQ